MITETKGYPEVWIKNKFHKPLIVIQRIIACAGRYSYFQAYHLRILAHFEDNILLNVPYLFYKSLEKISSQARKNTKNPSTSLCHHGIIKMLVMEELKKRDKSWNDFLQELSQSQEHPPEEDVPISPVENPDSSLRDFSQGYVLNSPSQNHEEDKPVSPIKISLVEKERSKRLSEKVPKRKRGSNRTKLSKHVESPRRTTQSVACQIEKPIPSEQVNIGSDPINLSSPSSSPSENASKKPLEDIT